MMPDGQMLLKLLAEEEAKGGPLTAGAGQLSDLRSQATSIIRLE